MEQDNLLPYSVDLFQNDSLLFTTNGENQGTFSENWNIIVDAFHTTTDTDLPNDYSIYKAIWVHNNINLLVVWLRIIFKICTQIYASHCRIFFHIIYCSQKNIFLFMKIYFSLRSFYCYSTPTITSSRTTKNYWRRTTNS